MKNRSSNRAGAAPEAEHGPERLKSMIDGAVRDALAPLAQRKQDRLADLAGRPERGGRSKGLGFARIVRALAATKGIPQLAADFAARTWGQEGEAIAKTLAAGSEAAGGFIVPERYSGEVIELLRARAVVRQAGAVVVPMTGSLLLPRVAAGATASYVGENQPIVRSQASFGQIRLTARKLAALVPISNDLLRSASPQADLVVLDDLIAGMAVAEDAAFLRDAGDGNAPKGLRFWAHPEQVSASRGTAPEEIEGDLADLVTALEGQGVRMIRPVWFMAPRIRTQLFVLRDAVGNLVFPELRASDAAAPYGRLWGYPVFPTGSIPSNLGSGDESEVYLADMADVVIAEDGAIEVSLSDAAAYRDGDAVVAAFAHDQTVVRAIARHDFALRHDRSAAVKTGVRWGA